MNNTTITINETKRLIKGHNLIIKDVSGHPYYGYDFAVFRSETVTEPIHYTRAVGEPLLTSKTTYFAQTVNRLGQLGAFSAAFNRSDIEALING